MTPEELRLSHSEATTNANLWDTISSQSWTPPPALTNKMLIENENEPRIWLSRAVDIMAFGDATRSENQVEVGARRQQAAAALCDAAKYSRVVLIGNPGPQGNKSEPIPPTYFDDPRCLGLRDNTLETKVNVNAFGMEQFVALRQDRRKHERFPVWSNVRVETKSFLDWFRSNYPSPPVQAESDCKDWLISEMRKSLMARTYKKEKFRQEAQNRFQGISKRAFDILWRAAIAESGASAWAKAGAPRKQ
jgi:hypothetical protein